MILRQLFDENSWTYTYLLADPETRRAVIIDPVAEQVERDMRLVEELGLELLYTMDTHVHADHVTGSGLIRDRSGAKTVAGEAADVQCIDIAAGDGQRLSFGNYEVEVRSTPGHTNGCVSFIVEADGQTYAFTGDALLIRGCGRTDFQQGSARSLYKSVRERIFSLPEDTLVYPGHDYRGHTASSVGEERAHNRRLRDSVSEDEFVHIMANLKLANPKLMDIAVPANMSCGLSNDYDAEATRRFNEAPAAALQNLDGFRIIDVRQPIEFNGELGHIEGAELIPLDGLRAAAEDMSRDEALLFVCRSGNRSRMACELFAEMGFRHLTNLAGGMIGWNANAARQAGGVR